MKAVWLDSDEDYRIDPEWDVNPNDLLFTGDQEECEEYIKEQENN